MTLYSNRYYLENKIMNLLKIYDVISDVTDDVMLEKIAW